MGVSANIRYYYLDEPAERGTYTQTQFYNVYAALARTLPSSQLCASSYDELQTFYWTLLHASNQILKLYVMNIMEMFSEKLQIIGIGSKLHIHTIVI